MSALHVCHSEQSAQRGVSESCHDHRGPMLPNSTNRAITREVAQVLNGLNTRFYAEHAASFSATRHSSWSGWDAALDAAGLVEAPRRVVDVACGNMRFADYLVERFPEGLTAYIGVDNCIDLASSAEHHQSTLSFKECDIIGCLIENIPLELPAGDLVVCSGFMHHVPGGDRRLRLLVELLQALEPGGTLVVSFWQFMADERLARKALALTPLALEELGLAADDLEPGDYVLGWQDSQSARRYCHSFTVDEVRALAHAARSQLERDFDFEFLEADGRSGRLNCYLVARELARS